MENVRVGKWVCLGRGSWECLPCNHLCNTRKDDGEVFAIAFSSESHFKRYLRTSACRSSRALSSLDLLFRPPLSNSVAYKVKTPAFKVQEEKPTRIEFKCSACNG